MYVIILRVQGLNVMKLNSISCFGGENNRRSFYKSSPIEINYNNKALSIISLWLQV